MNTTNSRKPEPAPIPQKGEIPEYEEPGIDLSPFIPPDVTPESEELPRPTDLDLNDAVVVPMEDRDDGLGGTAVRVDYTNDLGQDFALTAIAADERLARKELAAHRVYLRAVPMDEPPEYVSDPSPWIADSVAEITVKEMNAQLRLQGLADITLDDLIALRDDSSNNHSPTLEELVEAYQIESPSVFSKVVVSATRIYPSIDAAVVRDAVRGLWIQPDVPFIDDVYNASSDAEADRRIREELEADNSGIAVIEVALTDPTRDDGPADPDSPFVILFAFDPDINKKPSMPYVRHYRAKRQTSAVARIRRSAGRMTLYMWRKAPNHRKLGSRTASAARRYPPAISGRSGTAYDIRVRGKRNNSNYYVEGSWELGAGYQS